VVLAGPRANAGKSSSSFEVSATVLASCTFTIAPQALIFPTYISGQPIAGKGSTTIDIQCAGPAPGGMQAGQLTFSPLNPATAFQMGFFGFPLFGTINYLLCNDDPCTQPYTPGVPGPIFMIDRSSWPAGYTLHGQIPAGQNGTFGSFGTYSQNVDAMLTY
jgi:spore coat protein U-like protein